MLSGMVGLFSGMPWGQFQDCRSLHARPIEDNPVRDLRHEAEQNELEERAVVNATGRAKQPAGAAFTRFFA